MAKTTITIDKIIEDANRIKILNDSYLFSYPHFKRYFTDIKGDFTEHDLIIGIHFIYGWMPTIFEFKNGKTGKESIFEDKIIRKNISEAVEIVNKIRREDSDLTPSNYDLLKKLFNNSLVGTSKFLHFINSDKFAIWDSNVLAFLMTEKELVNSIGINNVIESIPNYMEYLSLLGEMSKCNGFSDLKNKVQNKLKQYGHEYVISDFRVLELILFTKGQEIQKKKIEKKQDRIKQKVQL